MAGLKVQLVQEYVEKEQTLIKECYKRRDELQHLYHLIPIKRDEKEQKRHELHKAQVTPFIYNSIQNSYISITEFFF